MLAEAITLLRRCMSAHASVHGADHAHVRLAAYNLGLALMRQVCHPTCQATCHLMCLGLALLWQVLCHPMCAIRRVNRRVIRWASGWRCCGRCCAIHGASSSVS